MAMEGVSGGSRKDVVDVRCGRQMYPKAKNRRGGTLAGLIGLIAFLFCKTHTRTSPLN